MDGGLLGLLAKHTRQGHARAQDRLNDHLGTPGNQETSTSAFFSVLRFTAFPLAILAC